MRWRWVAVVLLLATRVRGQEIPDPDEAAALPAGSSGLLGRALADRFVACAEAEHEAVSEADRTVIADAVGPLGDRVAQGLGAQDCAETPTTEFHCAEAIRTADCDALAHAMQGLMGASMAPAPRWAETHAGALVERIAACLIDERDGVGSSPEESAALEGLRHALASTLGALAASGQCRVDEPALSACVASVGELACGPLSTHLEEDPSRLASGVTPECARFLRCDGSGAPDGGEEPAVIE